MPGGYYPDTKITDRDGDYLKIFADGGILTHMAPESYQFYIHTIYDVPGVVAPNNFLSVFNPSGSGKNVIFYQAEIASYSNGATAVGVSMTATRITAASGGTLVAASNVARFATAWANPVAEVRTGNPTVTTSGLTLNAWVPPLSTGVGAGSTAYTTPPPGAGFVCTPGQGIVFNTQSGDTDQAWKINVVWAEG